MPTAVTYCNKTENEKGTHLIYDLETIFIKYDHQN